MSMIERCPKCGKSLDGVPTSMCGHLRKGDDKILFAACIEHFYEATQSVEIDPGHQSLGYFGEWKPEYGQIELAMSDD